MCRTLIALWNFKNLPVLMSRNRMEEYTHEDAVCCFFAKISFQWPVGS